MTKVPLIRPREQHGLILSDSLEKLYADYDISNLKYGERGDALGDLYEEFTESAFLSSENIYKFNKNYKDKTIEFRLLHSICSPYVDKIEKLQILPVNRRDSGGLPKTDLSILLNKMVKINLSIKQSVAKNVTAAEFDVATIRKEVKLSDPKLITLLEKFQRDNSAINFSKEEKESMTKLLHKKKKDLVRWILTGSIKKNAVDNRIANHILMYKLDKKEHTLKSFNSYSVEKHIEKLIKKTAGFGTGLSWTYATGSKGKKIQFKCPVY